MNTTSTQDKHAARSFYDRISSSYDLLADASEKHARETGLKALNLQPGERVLEIGFGTGHSLVELAHTVGPNGHVAGIDISEGMAKVASKHLEQAGVADRVELKVAGVPPIPFEDGSFDAVTMSFTLELFPLDSIPGVIDEIKRVLKPGGRLGVVNMATVPADHKESTLEHIYKWMHQHFPHIVDCQPIDSVKYAQEGGLKITNTIELSVWTLEVMAMTAEKPQE